MARMSFRMKRFGQTIAVAVFAMAAQAMAQSPAFPTRPITLVVPFPAGGPSDALGRGS
ncbi:hypothetical protein SAMN04488595_116114 [Ralstonia sp. 25mfcol4.1]|nr:hypothetical protein SAMN04488595_116114 [Ralstonia sp. 25mfcol4.1]